MGEAYELFRAAIFEILVVSTPLLLVGMVVGLVISVIQATTSIQEQTLTFVPKIVAILLTLVYFWPWIHTRLSEYTIAIFMRIAGMSG